MNSVAPVPRSRESEAGRTDRERRKKREEEKEQNAQLVARPVAVRPLDPREAPTRYEPVALEGEAELARDGREEEKRVAPRRVDLGPFNLAGER